MSVDANTQDGFDCALIDELLVRLGELPQGALVGLSGLQGSGKSRLAAQLARRSRAQGAPIATLSLDDFYFGRGARRRLAREVHPLLQTRGVPGTHDLTLLERTFSALGEASERRPVLLPRFDKGRDTRLPPSRWRPLRRPPRLILLEGWCVGLPPQAPPALRRPCNELERQEDPDGRWRHWVNQQLAVPYARLWARLDRLILLQAPDFEVVWRWRGQAENRLRQRGALQAFDAAALRRFLQHYERLSRHALVCLPQRAELRIVLDRARQPQAILASRGARRPRASG